MARLSKYSYALVKGEKAQKAVWDKIYINFRKSGKSKKAQKVVRDKIYINFSKSGKSKKAQKLFGIKYV